MIKFNTSSRAESSEILLLELVNLFLISTTLLAKSLLPIIIWIGIPMSSLSDNFFPMLQFLSSKITSILTNKNISIQKSKSEKDVNLVIHKSSSINALCKLISESKPRKATKPTKASQMRRVESKKKRGELKRNRQKTIDKDF